MKPAIYFNDVFETVLEEIISSQKKIK